MSTALNLEAAEAIRDSLATGPAIRAALDALDLEPDGTMSSAAATGVQAQGDLIVLPWAAAVSPARRGEEITAAKRIPSGGLRIHGDHRLEPGFGPIYWHGYPWGQQSLGLLYVPSGATAILAHDKPASDRPGGHEHPALHIGVGVYCIRRQRKWSPIGDTQFVED